jgi:Sporulation and spore germination
MRSPRRRLGIAVTAVLGAFVAAALVACGVPVDRSPRALSNVPFDLTPNQTTTTRPTRSGRTVRVDVFMVRDDRLVAVPRDVPAPATLRSVLTALLEGPTNDEAKSGLRTAIPGRTLLLSAAPDGSVGRVNVSDSLLDFEGQEQVAAVAQIVFSATVVTGIDGVVLSLSGRRVEPFAGDGTQISRPLQRIDFPFLFPA